MNSNDFVHLIPVMPFSFLFSLKIHKYCNGDSSEEYDKYFDSNWRVLYFLETSESESVGCHVFYGTVYDTPCVL